MLNLNEQYAIQDRIHKEYKKLNILDNVYQQRKREIMEKTSEVDPAAGFNHLRRVFIDKLDQEYEALKAKIEGEIDRIKKQYNLQ